MTSSLKFDSFSLQFSHQLTSKHTFCTASHEKFIIFSLFLKGTGSAGVPGLAGSCHRAALEERSCPGVTQCPEHALPPFPSPSISPQRVCLISRQTKPLEKHKATWGLKSQLCQYTHMGCGNISLHIWLVAEQRGQPGGFLGWLWAALGVQH